MQSIENSIKNRIYGSGKGSLFTPTQFLDLGGRDAVDKALSRLAARDTIQRLARGLYHFPKKHPVLGVLLPKPEEIAQAIARRDVARVQPTGAYAANLLGLSEQVPAKAFFLTDGLSRKVKLGSMEISLKQTTPS